MKWKIDWFSWILGLASGVGDVDFLKLWDLGSHQIKRKKKFLTLKLWKVWILSFNER